jgi:hypothetical protein
MFGSDIQHGEEGGGDCLRRRDTQAGHPFTPLAVNLCSDGGENFASS